MGGGCYKISDERMGWIEAKKMCEATNSQLLSFQSPEEAESLISFIRRIQVFLAVFWSIWPFGRFLAFLAVILAYIMYIYIFFSAPKNQVWVLDCWKWYWQRKWMDLVRSIERTSSRYYIHNTLYLKI